MRRLIFTIFASLLMITAWAGNSELNISSFNNAPFIVQLNNKRYAPTNHFRLKNVAQGRHRIKILRRIGNSPSQCGTNTTRVLYNGLLDVKDRTRVKARVGKHGMKVMSVEPIFGGAPFDPFAGGNQGFGSGQGNNWNGNNGNGFNGNNGSFVNNPGSGFGNNGFGNNGFGNNSSGNNGFGSNSGGSDFVEIPPGTGVNNWDDYTNESSFGVCNHGSYYGDCAFGCSVSGNGFGGPSTTGGCGHSSDFGSCQHGNQYGDCAFGCSVHGNGFGPNEDAALCNHGEEFGDCVFGCTATPGSNPGFGNGSDNGGSFGEPGFGDCSHGCEAPADDGFGSNGNMNPNPNPNPNGSGPWVGGSNPSEGFGFNEFKNLIYQMKQGANDQDKLRIAKQALNRRGITSAQVRDMVNLLEYEQNKLDLAKFAYKHTVDPENYYMVNSAFWYDNTTHTLNDFIRS